MFPVQKIYRFRPLFPKAFPKRLVKIGYGNTLFLPLHFGYFFGKNSIAMDDAETGLCSQNVPKVLGKKWLWEQSFHITVDDAETDNSVELLLGR
jgi:hypothetical protein